MKNSDLSVMLSGGKCHDDDDLLEEANSDYGAEPELRRVGRRAHQDAEPKSELASMLDFRTQGGAE